MNVIHATPEQTSIILRGHKRKKYMKNKNKNITNSGPGITLYPSRQFKKNTHGVEDQYHNSMKQHKGFDKKKKNMIYKEKGIYKILESRFGMNIKEDITPSKFNEKLGRYQNLSNDELENLKSSYARYYNSKVNESRLKYETIRDKYEKKKEIQSQRNEKRETRIKNIDRLNKKLHKELKMDEKHTNAKVLKKNDLICVILSKGSYSSVDQYINSYSDKELEF